MFVDQNSDQGISKSHLFNTFFSFHCPCFFFVYPSCFVFCLFFFLLFSFIVLFAYCSSRFHLVCACTSRLGNWTHNYETNKFRNQREAFVTWDNPESITLSIKSYVLVARHILLLLSLPFLAVLPAVEYINKSISDI